MRKMFVVLIYGFAFCSSLAATAQIITTIAGSSTVGFSGDGGPAITALLRYPQNIAVERTGNVFFSDYLNQRVRKINPSGFISTVAGNGTPGYSGDGIAATLAQLFNPSGLFLDNHGNLYIADASNDRIRKVDITGVISTIAGDGTPGYSGDGAAATMAQLQNPDGIAADSYGNIYFADLSSHCIRKIDAGGIITTIAGNGMPGFGGDGGPATGAELNTPGNITLDIAGNIYISDSYNHRIRKIDRLTGVITTIAGTGTGGYTGDGGSATDAKIYIPHGLATDSIGNLYFADPYFYSIVRKIDISGIITTVAGTGTPGFNGDGINATDAQLKTPADVAVDDTGNLYIADFANNRVRKIISGNHLPAVTGGRAQALTLCENDTAALNALLTVNDADTGQTETWKAVYGPLHGAAMVAYSTASTGGAIIPAGLYYAPAAGYTGNDTLSVRVNDGISVYTTTVYVTVNPPPHAGAITGADTVCKDGTPVTLTSATGGVWSSSNGLATVAGGVVSGIAAGTDTIRCIVSNSCGSDTATHIVHITDCPDEVGTTGRPLSGLAIYPNPADGAFTVRITSDKDQQVQLTVTNMMGERVRVYTTAANKPMPITLSVPPGVYLLTATAAHYQANTKIIVRQQR